MTPTHALIDIGNVLLAFDFEPALLRMTPPDGDGQLRIARLLEKKDDFESGRIPEDQFISWASGQLGFAGTPDAFRQEWNSIFTPILPMWSSIRDLKEEGLTLILFSNTNPIHAQAFAPDYEIFSLFDHAVFSHLVGAIKPNPVIFKHAIEAHGLDPARTLYLDDMAENISAGENLGFQCHQYDHGNHDAYQSWRSAL